MNTNSKFINMTCDNYYENPININNKLSVFILVTIFDLSISSFI